MVVAGAALLGGRSSAVKGRFAIVYAMAWRRPGPAEPLQPLGSPNQGQAGGLPLLTRGAFLTTATEIPPHTP